MLTEGTHLKRFKRQLRTQYIDHTFGFLGEFSDVDSISLSVVDIVVSPLVLGFAKGCFVVSKVSMLGSVTTLSMVTVDASSASLFLQHSIS